MKRYTDEELEDLLLDLESFRVERKQSWSSGTAKRIQQAVCAFANDLPGSGSAGVLFVGVRDDGTPTGLQITDQLLQQLAAIKTDGNIVPPPTLAVEKRHLAGHEVAVVTVEPSILPPVRFRGQIWIRTGSSRDIATEQDERILIERRRHGHRSYDAQPMSGSSIGDLNLRYFEEEYLPNAFDPEVIAANSRTTEQRLAATKMVSSAVDPTPTVLGLLTLSSRARDYIPAAYVQFLRIGGTEFHDPITDEAVLDGTLVEVIRKTEEKLAAHNRVAVDFTSQPLEQRTYAYPKGALEQFLRNALMHRTYEVTNAPVRVYWFDDRIEFHNPGGPFGEVTVETFGQMGWTDYRNPGLAEALRVLGFVQRYGVGISTARDLLAKNGNPPPEFRLDPRHVLVTVRRLP